jgi:hypothetical protein
MKRMSDTQEPSEAARQLARARWGDSVVRRAVGVVVERQAELDAGLRAELRALTSQEGTADE